MGDTSTMSSEPKAEPASTNRRTSLILDMGVPRDNKVTTKSASDDEDGPDYLTGYEPRKLRRPTVTMKCKEIFNGDPKQWPDFRAAFRFHVATYKTDHYDLLWLLDLPKETIFARAARGQDEQKEAKIRV